MMRKSNGAHAGHAAHAAEPLAKSRRGAGTHAAHARTLSAKAVAIVATLVLACSGAGVCFAADAVGGASAGTETIDAPATNDTPKREVVYGTLSQTGAVEGVYVVNVLEPDAPGTVVDFGTYTQVANMTDGSALAQDGDAVQVDVAGAELTYQGDLGQAALPWQISVRYTIDGVEVTPEEAAGATGEFGLEITTTKNPAVNSTYYDNYLVQISVTLSPDVASNVACTGGQIAMAGSDTQVTFMAMPGQDGSFTLTAQVTDFSMAGITFAAVPLSFAIDVGDTSELTSGFDQLASGVSQLTTSAEQLATGAGELSSGAAATASGAQTLADGSAQIAQGLATYQSELQSQAAALSEQAAALGLDDDMAAGLQQALAAYTTAYTTAYTSSFTASYTAAYSQAILTRYAEAEAAGATGQTALQQALMTAGMQDAPAAAANAAAAAGQAAAQDATVLAAAQTLGSYLQKAGLVGGANALSGAAQGLSAVDPATGQSLLGSLDAFSQGMISFSSGAGQLASGIDTYAQGVGTYASGMGQLSSQVQGIPAELEQAIDDMIAQYDGSDYVPVSFTSSKNTNVELVQFVITTAAIEPVEEEVVVEEEPEPSLIDKFLDLFR